MSQKLASHFGNIHPQRAALPFLGGLINLIGDYGNGRCGEFYLINLPHLLFNI